jgi:hypothetical protein
MTVHLLRGQSRTSRHEDQIVNEDDLRRLETVRALALQALMCLWNR